MMAPTERSMPAVRMTSVWAMPSVPMIVTCCRTSDRLNGAKKPTADQRAKITTPDQQDDERHRGRIGVEEVLEPPERRRLLLLEAGDVAVGLGSTLLDIRSRRRPCRSLASLMSCPCRWFGLAR